MSRFTETQIVGMIKEQEAGMPTAEMCRKHGVSQDMFLKFRAKYGGMDVSDAVKLRTLGDAAAEDGFEEVAEQIAVAEPPVSVLRESRVVRDRVGQVETTKPSIRQVHVDLLAQPPLRSDAHGVA